jgi:predicted ATPase
LLDTTRAYALEKLEEHAEVDVVLRRHGEYVAGHLESQRVALLAIGADKLSHVPSSGEPPNRLKLVRMRCRGG